MDRLHFAGGRLSAAINPFGAELSSLQFDGQEMLWQAGPAWTRHAPVLFPIVGRLAGDTLRHQGIVTRLTQHGFARDRLFDIVAADAGGCTLALSDDEATRALYPFAFRLSLTTRIEDEVLTTDYRLENPAAVDLLASIGTHPGFRWPLADGIAKDAHRLVFEADESEPLLRLRDGLIDAGRVPSPVHGRVLGLSEAVFAHDALIFDRPVSRRLRYEAPGAPSIEVAWDGFTALGIWSRPADFICIEPWSGLSDAAGYDGEFADRPEVLRVAPGATVTRRLSIRVVPA